MAIPLGTAHCAIAFPCLFMEAVTQGQAVSLVTPLATLESIDDKVLSVELFDTNAKGFGVAKQTTGIGKHGLVVVYGLVQCVTGADITAYGQKITADTDGSFKDWSTGIEHGIALEAFVTGSLTWCLVNFIGAAGGFGGT